MIVFALPNSVRVTQRGSEIVDSESTRIDGQRVVIFFFHDEEEDAANIWHVGLLVGATRKAKKQARMYGDWGPHYDDRTTGRSGLKALVWAVAQINKFQEGCPEATLVVGTTDPRRARVYRALTRYGFEEGVYQEETVLFRSPAHFRRARVIHLPGGP